MKKKLEFYEILGIILNWIYGIFFLFMGFGVMINNSAIYGILVMLCSVLVLPYTNKITKEKFNFRISVGIKVVLVILILIFLSLGLSTSSNNNSNTQETREDNINLEQKSQDTKENEEVVKDTGVECPDFSSLSDRISCGKEECTYEVIDIGSGRGLGQVGEYKLYPWGYSPGDIAFSSIWAPCKRGRYKGENINYFYCEGIYVIMKETDSEGNILSSKESYVTLVVSNSKIIDSICKEI